MSSLKERLAKLSVKAIEVPAPEFGDGEVVHVKRLTIGERTMFNEIVDRHKQERAEKPGVWLVDQHLAELVVMVAANADGSVAFAPGELVEAQIIPGSLAERMVPYAQEKATDATAKSEADAKKPSPSSPVITNSIVSSS
jgi:hypothetical protein